MDDWHRPATDQLLHSHDRDAVVRSCFRGRFGCRRVFSGLGLRDTDQVRIVDKSVVPTCGAEGANTSAPTVTHRPQRTRGNATFSEFVGIIVRKPGVYLGNPPWPCIRLAKT